MTVLRVRGLSVRFEPRSPVVAGVLAAALAVVAVFSLATGDFPLSPSAVIDSLLGQGTPGADFIVQTIRLPRLLTAILVGAALGASGAILQRLSGNPLGSPDIIGFTYGSSTGALIMITVVHGSMMAIAAGALVGGLATAVAIYALAFGRGGVSSRFVLVGIGIGALLLSVNSYLITRASWQDALAAQAWLFGTVNGRGWDHVTLIAVSIAVLLPIAGYFARRLALLDLGDDLARALGVGVDWTRFALIVTSVALAAFATAATGPVWFLALAAPQLAHRLTRGTGPGMMTSAWMGALLLALSDLGVQRLFPDTQLPVGTATGVLGGFYLIWFLATRRREGRA
ncbi:FecCD family ABC transporter permease [Actinokineospora sp. HUAS TT18]|uniref:FecCD family ABC transporter permease n=1 Tax=Actinokineospora sp. HUAS TT18 TaxID=3447451 RepID=UPI003F522E7F